jgi:primosomal protein N'
MVMVNVELRCERCDALIACAVVEEHLVLELASRTFVCAACAPAPETIYG